MTLTLTAPATTVEIVGRGYAKAQDAFSVAAKVHGFTTRGGKYFDETDERFPVLDREEGAQIFLGYRWLAQVDGRWFVTIPA